MKTRTIVLAALFPALALGLGACRSSSKDNPDSGMNNGDGQNGDDTSIYDIQDPTNKIQIGQQVNVRGVVVTAIDNYGAKKGDFWVEEPAGGAYSGVHVYGASLSDVAAIQVGDLVDVTGGVKNEFALTGSNADPTGRTVTELQPASGGSIAVAKVGDGTVPDPAAVDALAIGTMADPADQDAEWEKWEGVLVKLDNVAVVGSVQQIGGSMPDPLLQKFPVTGPVYAESSLAAFPTPAVAAGDCLTSITGVEDYFYDYLILPRSIDEVATGGASCPAPETGTAACGDGVDNDANGHADCGDYSCITDPTVTATCVQDTTVSAINMGTNPTPAVNLKSVYVTGIAFNQKNLWVADDLAGAQYNGVYVYRGSSAATLDAQIEDWLEGRRRPGHRVRVPRALRGQLHPRRRQHAERHVRGPRRHGHPADRGHDRGPVRHDQAAQVPRHPGPADQPQGHRGRPAVGPGGPAHHGHRRLDDPDRRRHDVPGDRGERGRLLGDPERDRLAQHVQQPVDPAGPADRGGRHRRRRHLQLTRGPVPVILDPTTGRRFRDGVQARASHRKASR